MYSELVEAIPLPPILPSGSASELSNMAATSTLNCTNPANVTSCFGPLDIAENNLFIMVYELWGRLFGTVLSTALFGKTFSPHGLNGK